MFSGLLQRTYLNLKPPQTNHKMGPLLTARLVFGLCVHVAYDQAPRLHTVY